MLPISIDDLPTGENWAYEVKWDGIRALCHVTPRQSVHIISRRGLDYTARYPELGGLQDLLTRPCVLDGEIIALSAAGKPDFARVLRRERTTTSRQRLDADVAESAIRFVAFDLLAIDDRALLDDPWQKRRQLLQELVGDGQGCAQFSTEHSDGAVLWRVTAELSLEGVVAKERMGLYRTGTRSDTWRKRRHLQTTHALVVGLVWFADRPRSLLMVKADTPELYIGRVGVGVPAPLFSHLASVTQLDLAALPLSLPRPGAGERFSFLTDPFIIAVRFAQWTETGLLRQPVYVGIVTHREEEGTV